MSVLLSPTLSLSSSLRPRSPSPLLTPPCYPPLLILSLSSHQVTSGTSSEPYWLTRPPFLVAIFALVTFLGISTLLLVNHTGSPSAWWVPHAYPLFSVSSPFSPLLSFSFPLLSSLISKLWRHSSPIPTPHVMGDFLPRLVALKAVDPTFLKTTMITGPVALCVPPFDKLGRPLHFVVGPPALVELLPLSSFRYLLIR